MKMQIVYEQSFSCLSRQNSVYRESSFLYGKKRIRRESLGSSWMKVASCAGGGSIVR